MSTPSTFVVEVYSVVVVPADIKRNLPCIRVAALNHPQIVSHPAKIERQRCILGMYRDLPSRIVRAVYLSSLKLERRLASKPYPNDLLVHTLCTLFRTLVADRLYPKFSRFRH
jgi:hypothetical protein